MCKYMLNSFVTALAHIVLTLPPLGQPKTAYIAPRRLATAVPWLTELR